MSEDTKFILFLLLIMIIGIFVGGTLLLLGIKWFIWLWEVLGL